jgi:hypothetical protein
MGKRSVAIVISTGPYGPVGTMADVVARRRGGDHVPVERVITMGGIGDHDPWNGRSRCAGMSDHDAVE